MKLTSSITSAQAEHLYIIYFIYNINYKYSHTIIYICLYILSHIFILLYPIYLIYFLINQISYRSLRTFYIYSLNHLIQIYYYIYSHISSHYKFSHIISHFSCLSHILFVISYSLLWVIYIVNLLLYIS